MSDAGREEVLPEGRNDISPEVRVIADYYLDASKGDVTAALLRAVEDGLAVSQLVSSGFVRRGPRARPPR